MSIASEIQRIKTNISNAYAKAFEKGATFHTRLPNEYQEVEYIESTGTQYIDTGVYTGLNVAIESKIAYTNATQSLGWNGAVYGASEGWIAFGDYNTGKLASYFCTSTRSGVEIDRDTQYHKYYVSNGLQKIDEIKNNITITTIPTSLKLFLFKGNNNYDTSVMAKQKMKYCKIWDSNVLIRDFIPCYRKSDNEAGLYDLVNNIFYENAGTGDFLLGATVTALQNSDNLASTIETITSGGSGQYDWFYNVRTNNGTTNHALFAYSNFLTTLDLSNLDTSNVNDMSYMFYYCQNLTNLNLSSFDTSKVTSMNSMFYSCKKLTNLGLSNFDTSNVNDMGYMFYNCDNLKSVDLSSFDTSKVTSMNHMFYNCRSLTSVDLSNFDTSKVTKMNHMFYYCDKLTSLDLSNFDTSNVNDMSYMFYYCKNLKSVDLSNFDTSNVTKMDSFFVSCEKLISIEGIIDLIKITSVAGMFGSFSSSACTNLTTVYLKNLNTTGLNLTYCTSLSYESLMYLLNNLTTTTTTKTLTLGATNLAKLTEEEIAIGTNKGWTIA